MNIVADFHADITDTARSRALSITDLLRTHRCTMLEEMRRELPGPHVRSYFRPLGLERRPLQLAVVRSAQLDRELELEVRSLGLDGIAIREPSDEEIVARDDYELLPEWVRWVMACPLSTAAWIASLPSSQARNQLRRKLRASRGIRAEVAPLILSDYRQWYQQLYVPQILGRAGAIPAWENPSDFARGVLGRATFATGGSVQSFLRIFLYDELEELVGGVLVSIDEADRTLRIRAAAFAERARAEREVAVRAMESLIETANARGFWYLSYGDDPNLFGLDVSLGLQRFKIGIGMRPVPSPIGQFQLLKLFDDTARRVAPEGEPAPGLFWFAVVGAGYERIRALHELKSACAEGSCYEERIGAMTAHTEGVQFGSELAATPVRVPSGMPLRRPSFRL